MIYRKRVTERYNMGSYEHIEVSAEVEYDPAKEDIDDVELTLDHMLARERLLAKQLTTEDNSLAHAHPALTKPHTKRS
ncbi:hypothetical protein GCM10010331_45290 [Streptomyces xanthochromogenes]|uniref:hypothetical protein n=1 Tax=Streptomyces xanthochromogenes TaxID=67384 RepID=UPI00167B440F|nr:hypothetical protein [Streptomyces xanthochromogenes]GHB52598.1 hypothetical protein GCM10010331_45290 [Streptomyces xanthochromogenes]